MGYKTASPDRYGLLKAFARENRRQATEAETLLWDCLRSNSMGVKFLRQHIIGDYIVDFVSREDGLIIEVDGGYHAEPRQMEDDLQREAYLEHLGYHVMRFTNEEVMFNTDWVIQEIENYFNK
jgi:very-short-patch-repair endonuclease